MASSYGFVAGVVGLAVAFDAEAAGFDAEPLAFDAEPVAFDADPLALPFIAPVTAGADCSDTSVTESGLMTIIMGLPCESLARTRKDEGMMVMSLKPAFVRSSRSL
jgi:hypothetical protein